MPGDPFQVRGSIILQPVGLLFKGRSADSAVIQKATDPTLADLGTKAPGRNRN